MRKIKIAGIAGVVVIAAAGLLVAQDRWTARSVATATSEHADGEEGRGHEKEEPQHGGEAVVISEAASKNAGLVLEEAGPAVIRDTVPLTGKIALNQNKVALIKARFPGIIRSLAKSQGDTVLVGEQLATVESNESLQVYPITSPLSGTILSRSGSIGDMAADEPLFMIANLDELWAELHVFAQDAGRIKAGQGIRVSSSECEEIQSVTIKALLPITEASSQTLLVRAAVKNLDSHWLPGMSVRAYAIVSTVDAPLAVRTRAIQRLEGKQVIFVQHDGKFESRELEIGLADDEWTEVRSGIDVGETYVSDGSFTVKAEIGKSEAEHSH